MHASNVYHQLALKQPRLIKSSTLNILQMKPNQKQTCRDILKPVGLDKCTLTDYIEDCVNDEGLIDYVAFFFCAFSPEKMPLALFISVSR